MKKKKLCNFTDKSRERIFDKYANKYNIDKEWTKEKQAHIDRQRYLFNKIHEKGLENTNAEKLLDIILSDIQHQYSMKQDMENKVGFIMALWGVLIAIVLDSQLPTKVFSYIICDKLPLYFRLFCVFTFVGLCISGILSFFFITATLLTDKYSKALYDDKENNFKCSVDDKYMSIVVMLDTNTNVWIKNENTNTQKAKRLRKLIITIGIFIIFIILSNYM